ncbi:uncharacterized protein J3R85_019503 [Psidium guajava]|nr:uncharacterized protein J3R85_019503 [Psidium guajava]
MASRRKDHPLPVLQQRGELVEAVWRFAVAEGAVAEHAEVVSQQARHIALGVDPAVVNEHEARRPRDLDLDLLPEVVAAVGMKLLAVATEGCIALAREARRDHTEREREREREGENGVDFKLQKAMGVNAGPTTMRWITFVSDRGARD